MSRLSSFHAVLLLSALVLRNNAVTGITFTLNPNKVLLGSTGDMIYMRCAFLDEQVDSLIAMQIQRLTGNTWEILALLKPSNDPITSLTDPLPSDLQSKGLSVSDSFDPNDHLNTELTLTIPRNNIQCSDARDYRCSIVYLEVTGDTYASRTVSMNDTLMAAELPVITSLVGKKNGYIVEGPSPSHQASFDIGDVLELTCTANIGSFDYTTIKWRQSSETTTDFIDYNPLSGTFTPGTATSNGQCGYTRIASITYNTTNTDVNRQSNLAFKCYVTVTGSPYSNDYTTASNLSFYADIVGTMTQSTVTTVGTTTQSTVTTVGTTPPSNVITVGTTPPSNVITARTAPPSTVPTVGTMTQSTVTTAGTTPPSTVPTVGTTTQSTVTTEYDSTTVMIVGVILGLTNVCTIVYAAVLTVMLKRNRLSNAKHPSNRDHEDTSTEATYVNDNLRMTGLETNTSQNNTSMQEITGAGANNYACLDQRTMYDRNNYASIQSAN